MATLPRPVEPSKKLAERIRDSFQKALEAHDKVATGDTLRGIKVKIDRDASSITYSVYAGPGFYYTQWGKRANTKLPVYKEGNKFKLVEPLARWKKARGLTMPDFLLARSIARKARAPIDLIGIAAKDITGYLDEAIIKEIGMEKYVALQLSKI